ncbi:alpha-2-macroglobulin family protein, partial [bacterium]|nr:alpha-2-macroglobulin family protein [bacterium]
TESFPLWVRGPETRKFEFKKLKENLKSSTLEPFRFTVQMASNPAWYAVQALPYLMEFPHECSEQVFNRLYANSLADFIANSNPKIRKIFDSWRGTDALKSNLEKNQDLKSVLLEETPWVVQAKNETQAKKNVGILFEKNTLTSNLTSAFDKLEKMQLSAGAWPWFPGGRPSEFITLYVVTGFGKLRHLGVKVDMKLAFRAINYLDNWIKKIYDRIKHRERNHLSSTIALYLYGRSFYLKEKPILRKHKEAIDYFLGQGEKFWLSLGRMNQGHLALAMNRFGKKKTPKKVMKSIKERSVSNPEMGMFWRETEHSWWWYRAPIETQAIMIEAFDEVMKDEQAVDDCQVWLLKQKQTQCWKTTKSTADAIYALLQRGNDLLASDKIVQVKLTDMVVKPTSVEPGTGFYEKIYDGSQVESTFADITVIKEDKGIAWGGVFFQYFEDMSKVTSHKTNLSLEKKLFVKKNSKKGPEIHPVKGALEVGDLVTVRITLRVDRDMEFVHMKDHRGSGLEPVNVLSNYKFQDGLMYYEATKDTASHFFIDYLPKGTYVFEYELRVQLKGRYQTGFANIQCMYAPEFSSHSESIWLEVK